MKHDPHLRRERLTAVMVRGRTELRVRVDEEMSYVLVKMDGTPCPVLLGVTVTGADNLHTAITTGLADLAARQHKTTLRHLEVGACIPDHRASTNYRAVELD